MSKMKRIICLGFLRFLVFLAIRGDSKGSWNIWEFFGFFNSWYIHCSWGPFEKFRIQTECTSIPCGIIECQWTTSISPHLFSSSLHYSAIIHCWILSEVVETLESWWITDGITISMMSQHFSFSFPVTWTL